MKRRKMAVLAAFVLAGSLCACADGEVAEQGKTLESRQGVENRESTGGTAEEADEGMAEEMAEELTGETVKEVDLGIEEPDMGRERQTSLRNPITSVQEETWYDYGTGDPFVMRYDGRYYLYMSTRDTEVGVKCFSSRDLVNWIYQGLCTTEELTKGAYAPEVVYYNGSFYMYTSPAGRGHYVLKGDSPVGPFVADSDNFGLSIDGSVFIDDDGKWYFLHAGDNCIMANEMTAPNEVSPISKTTNTSMGGWTEGAMMVKQDGRYYMTYTGNHVFSKGYRIDCAVGESFWDIAPIAENPVLIHTLGETYGIGHSSTVKGPDLDSFYIVYHTLTGRAREGMPKREMNIDRIVFNGNRMEVMGPTTSGQQLPAFPKVHAFFDDEEEAAGWSGQGELSIDRGLTLESGSRILSGEGLDDTFTAEYNLCSAQKTGTIGGYFHYLDEENHGAFEINLGTGEFRIVLVEDGTEKSMGMELPESFGEPVDFGVNQTFQIEKKDGVYEAYFQDRLLGTFTCGLQEGSIGYYAEGCTGRFGYIGGSEAAGGSSACTYEKPVPGTIQGIHYGAASGEVLTVEGLDGSSSVRCASADSALEYTVRVEEDGLYHFSLLYAAEGDSELRISIDDAEIAREKLEATGGFGNYRTAPLQAVALQEGTHRFRMQIAGGNLELSEFSFARYEEVEEVLREYEEQSDELLYSDGTWQFQDGVLKLTDPSRPVGKRLYGSEAYGDYTVEADIRPMDEDMDIGLIFRVRNPAKGGAGDDAVMGTYFLQGYYAGLTKKGLCLLKINYGREQLAEVPMEFAPGQEYHMKAEVEGCRIRVYIDDELCLEYEDEDRPFLYGSAGIRGFMCNAEIDDFRMK